MACAIRALFRLNIQAGMEHLPLRMLAGSLVNWILWAAIWLGCADQCLISVLHACPLRWCNNYSIKIPTLEPKGDDPRGESMGNWVLVRKLNSRTGWVGIWLEAPWPERYKRVDARCLWTTSLLLMYSESLPTTIQNLYNLSVFLWLRALYPNYHNAAYQLSCLCGHCPGYYYGSTPWPSCY